jgi:DNA-binding XRE family transcriptional regulator
MANNRLKQILEDEGITQASLARHIGRSKELINKVCSKKHTPAITTQNQIAKGLSELSGKNYTREEIFLDKKG